MLGVAYELTISPNSTPDTTICSYKAILAPRASAILWGSRFGEPPLGWKVNVSVGSESDTGVLGYAVYSNPFYIERMQRRKFVGCCE